MQYCWTTRLLFWYAVHKIQTKCLKKKYLNMWLISKVTSVLYWLAVIYMFWNCFKFIKPVCHHKSHLSGLVICDRHYTHSMVSFVCIQLTCINKFSVQQPNHSTLSLNMHSWFHPYNALVPNWFSSDTIVSLSKWIKKLNRYMANCVLC